MSWFEVVPVGKEGLVELELDMIRIWIYEMMITLNPFRRYSEDRYQVRIPIVQINSQMKKKAR